MSNPAETKRQNGYYWVIFKSEDKFRIAFYEDGFWFWMSAKWPESEHPFRTIKEQALIPPNS